MSEKYDGIRVKWTGTQIYSRSGKEIKSPSFFTKSFPSFSLDGELWYMNFLRIFSNNAKRIKRGLQQESLLLTKFPLNEELWKNATFCIFDVPDLTTEPYESRLQFLLNFSQNKSSSFLKVIDTVQCKSKEHLNEFMKNIVLQKGEGVMLRQPGSFYETGRSLSMRKYKEYLDTEVKVEKIMLPQGFECVQ